MSIALQAAAAAWKLGVPWEEALKVSEDAMSAAGLSGPKRVHRKGQGKGKGRA